MPEFQTAYQEKILPILSHHGLTESARRSRATADSVFARLFEVNALSDVSRIRNALERDTMWSAAMRELGIRFGTGRSDGQIRHRFAHYASPAGSGRHLEVTQTTQAGSGSGSWRSYYGAGKLSSPSVMSILQDREGNFWFGTWGGLTRYDGQTWTTFTTDDGLAHNFVEAILQDREGNFWFGTRGGISRYDGRHWSSFTERNGLANNIVHSILQDGDERLWFGTKGGVSRYHGKVWTTFTTQDGLVQNDVRAVFQDREGYLWFGTWAGGVSRYDGRTFTSFSVEDGLVSNLPVRTIIQDREGYLWFGTGGGVSRYDGKAFINFTTADGLAHNTVRCIIQDHDGHLWFGTDDGVSKYDGRMWTTFTTRDGLANKLVLSVFQDRHGHIWFGTFGGGVSRYDGRVFQTLSVEDGLPTTLVTGILEDERGALWFCTQNGLTRFRPPSPSQPGISIEAIVADRRYGGDVDMSVPSTVGMVAFEFLSRSFRTRPGGMVYRYRLKGYDEAWKNTRNTRVEYQDLPRGGYTFEVVAVDRDLVYSESPAAVRLTVHLPYERIGWLSALGIAILLIVWQGTRLLQRDRKLQDSNAALSSANRELFDLNRDLEQKTRDLETANRQVQEQTERKSRFLSSITHELRTPMNAILGFTRIVLRRGADQLSERHRDNLDKVIQSAERLLKLINELLDLSRIEAGRVEINLERFVVKALIETCCAEVTPLVDDKPDVTLTCDLPNDNGDACTDRGRLHQIVMNLLSNAIKFTEKGQVSVRTAREDDHLAIAVSDTGAGIPADELDAIFEEFQQVKGSDPQRKGSGLGLPITKGFAELLGGTIHVESQVGAGSTFTVRIPATYRNDPK